MATYNGRLVAGEDAITIRYDDESWSLAAENTDNEALVEYAAMVERWVRDASSTYGPANGPYLRYCLAVAMRASGMVLEGGLPEEPEGSDPERIY